MEKAQVQVGFLWMIYVDTLETFHNYFHCPMNKNFALIITILALFPQHSTVREISMDQWTYTQTWHS